MLRRNDGVSLYNKEYVCRSQDMVVELAGVF